MSLAIDIDSVTGVLLADGWHEVINDSFDLDAYEYMQGEGERRTMLFGGGHEKLIPATGFTFQSAGSEWITGPLTSILAVRF